MTKDLKISYVTDDNGQPTAVQISYEDWQEISKQLSVFKEYIALKEELTTSFEEVKSLKKDQSKRVSLNDFLNES